MKQSIEEFLANGGTIQHIYYKTFEEVEMEKGDLKAIGYAWKKSAYLASQAGIKSGESRRTKALEQEE